MQNAYVGQSRKLIIYISKHIATPQYEGIEMGLYKYLSMAMFSWYACIAKLVTIIFAQFLPL